MGDFTPGFLPAFGVGAPGAGVSVDAIYFDTGTTPYTGYVYNNGWKQFASLSAVNATNIQGHPIDITAPTLNQKLTYNISTGEWTAL